MAFVKSKTAGYCSCHGFDHFGPVQGLTNLPTVTVPLVIGHGEGTRYACWGLIWSSRAIK